MNNQTLVINLDETEKAVFFRKTYAHVAGAVLVFILIEAIFLNIQPLVKAMLHMTQGYLWIAFLGLFWLGSIVANKFAHSFSKSKQYLGLGIYIIIEALIFIPILYIAMNFTGTQVIKQAGTVTLFLFIGLTAAVFMTNKNFSFLRTGITILTFIAIGLIVAGMIFGFQLGLWFSVLMVILAGASILYQTSKIKYEYNSDQYVGAALGLFASLMLLFWYILRIFMSKE